MYRKTKRKSVCHIITRFKNELLSKNKIDCENKSIEYGIKS